MIGRRLRRGQEIRSRAESESDAGAGDSNAGHACLMQFDTGLAGFIFLEPVKLNLPEDNSAKHDRSHKCRLPVQNIMGGMAGIAGRDMRIGLARKAADLDPPAVSGIRPLRHGIIKLRQIRWWYGLCRSCEAKAFCLWVC